MTTTKQETHYRILPNVLGMFDVFDTVTAQVVAVRATEAAAYLYPLG